MKNDLIIKKMTLVSVIGNTFLSLFKLIAGIIGKSSAMVSDAIHSLSDVFSTIVAVIGVLISKKAADKSHPYGHERFEPVAAIILCDLLFIVGLFLGYNSFLDIINKNYLTKDAPGIIALVAAIVSIITKELMFQYTYRNAKKINSTAFIADAWHHRSDALSSIGALVGIFGSMLGYKILENIASIVICLFIFKACYDIFMDAINKLVDTPCSEEFENELLNFVKRKKGVIDIDLLKTRNFGNMIYIDIEISVDENLSLKDAHSIAHRVHDAIEKKYENVKHVMVHVNPYEASKS